MTVLDSDVMQGSIGIAINNGQVEVYSPGRHCLVSPFSKKRQFQIYPLTQAAIERQQLHIITVAEGEYALASKQGQPLILGPGEHVYNSPFFILDGRVSQDAEVISHKTLHRVIVKQGKRAIAMDGQQPLLLQPGVYSRKSPLFQFVRSVPVDEQIVNLDPFIIVTAFEGEVGVAFKRGRLEVRCNHCENFRLSLAHLWSRCCCQALTGCLRSATKNFSGSYQRCV